MGRVKQIMLLLFLLPLMTVEGKTNESSSNDSKVAINSAPKADTTAFDDPCFIAELGTLGVPLTKTGKINVLDPITLDSLSSIKKFSSGEDVYIKSLKGIEYLINLEAFGIETSQLDSLNLSANKRLKWLYCSSQFRGNLKFLDVSGCANLEVLECDNNQLKELDLSANSKLKSLYCSQNSIRHMNISDCANLEHLECSYNRLEELDLSSSSKLQSLRCTQNRIQQINISGCVDLLYLDCDYNSINSLDLTTNANLKVLKCTSNKLLSLDLSNNKKLTIIKCAQNYIDSIDISMLPPFVGDAKLELNFQPQTRPSAIDKIELELNDFPNLNAKVIAREGQEWIDIVFDDPNFIAKLGMLGVPLTETGEINVLDPITLDSLRSIKKFSVSSRDWDIKSLKGIEYLINLEIFYGTGVKSYSLNLSANKRLKEINCSSSYIDNFKFLDVSGCVNLEVLDCRGRNLRSLDVSGCTNLEELNCGDNVIYLLDLSANKNLKFLTCSRGGVSDLNISGCVDLIEIGCDDNNLRSLDLSTNVNLTYLGCSYNELRSLDLSNNKKLKIIGCNYNYMDSIDISMIPPFVGDAKLELDFQPQIRPSAIDDRVIDSDNCPNPNSKVIAREGQEWYDTDYEH